MDGAKLVNAACKASPKAIWRRGMRVCRGYPAHATADRQDVRRAGHAAYNYRVMLDRDALLRAIPRLWISAVAATQGRPVDCATRVRSAAELREALETGLAVISAPVLSSQADPRLAG
jgi:hypothetical protein